ncbi:MAG: FxDxF family PEP-CTERM protein [Thiobacillus sp.]|nr:FxDxF family PEP-CTERM protein [Thiobacillus sp.]
MMDNVRIRTYKTAPKLAILALLIGLSAASSAQAITYNAGTLSTTPYISTPTVLGAFSDRYDFTVAALPSVAGASVAVNLDLGNLSFHITGLDLDLFTAGGSWLAGDAVTGPTDVAVSLNSTLAAGNYYFRVQGTADGVGTGAGIYTFTAAAVPEADTYAMMLAGLGLVGYSVSRRKRNFS